MDCNHAALYNQNEIEDQWLESKMLCSGLFYLWNISETFFFTFKENSGITFILILFIVLILIKCQLMVIERFMFKDFEFLINKNKLFEFTGSIYLLIAFYGSILAFEQTWNITYGMNGNRIIFKDNSILIFGLTFGMGMIFLLQKKPILKIPIYSSILSFFAIFCYLGIVGIIYLMEGITITILIFTLAFYILIIFGFLKLSASDKNSMETMRKELDNDIYEFSYQYPEDKKKGEFSEDGKNSLKSLTNSENYSISESEQKSKIENSKGNSKFAEDEELDSLADSNIEKKKEKVELNVGSEDSFVDETDSDVSDAEEMNKYKQNLLLLLEQEMKPKDTIFESIKKPFYDGEEKKTGPLTLLLEEALIWLFVFTIPCQDNYFKKEYYEIGLYFVGFVSFFYILIDIPIISILLLSFIISCFFFILRFFLGEDQKKVIESCVTLTFCWCYLIKINFFFFDVLTFFKFWSNLYIVEIMQMAGLPILFPIIVFNYILIQKGRTLLAYTNILQVILFYLFGFFVLEGIASLIIGKNEFRVIDAGIYNTDVDKIYLDFNFQLFIIIFTILLFGVYFWMRKFTTDKTFGYCLIGIGGFYFVVQNGFSYYHIISLDIYA